GKIVFLNFWATWCPHCSDELPYIQELYEEYSSDEASDVAILGVTFPGGGQELDKEGIKEYISEGGYTFPVLMDEEYTLAAPYYITSYPTTYIISPEGKVLGYIPGAMTKDIMLDVIDQAREISGLS
ncbi:MAG: TlpA family protein disulfide reductase, partial [Lachnospiraceae bacterium]|nr:TlpA family protein disulfide reductase [Lachnospiraceae bacterium]